MRYAQQFALQISVRAALDGCHQLEMDSHRSNMIIAVHLLMMAFLMLYN